MCRRKPPVFRALVGVASLTLTALLAACSAGAPDEHGQSDSSSALSTAHIHGVTRDPEDGSLLVATHEGLYRDAGDGPARVGPEIDLMAFVIAPDGTYYALGHPGPGSSLPQPVGLVSSTDRGATWRVVSRGGESDFHALAAGPESVAGYDGRLAVTSDGTSWTERPIASPPADLAASTSGRLLAATEAGLLSSTDDAATWTTLDPPGLVAHVEFADDATVVGVTTDGRVVLSQDAGTTWSSGGTAPQQVEALGARRTPDGTVEVLLAVEGGVFRSTDGGQMFERLV
jgi:photosystem II stability/assembly factor-like uncharacterized protein